MLHRAFARQMRKIFPKNHYPALLIACSGGVDSMVLLDLCRDYYRRHGKLHQLEAVYLNHGQRPPSETGRDQAVIQNYCAKHAIKFTARDLKLSPGLAEAALRQHRYQALGQVAMLSKKRVLTAHHAQDDLETYWLRLLRGAHPDTLKGIAPRARRTAADGTPLKLARPLLFFTKEELLAHARAQRLEWHEDSTNRNPRYARNRVRAELLPLLENLRPGAAKRLHRFFRALGQNQPRAQNRQTEPARVAQTQKHLLSKEGYCVEQADFATLKATIDALLQEQSHRTTQSHWENLKRQLKARQTTRHGGGPAKTLQFPGGGALAFRGNRLFWVKN